MTPVVALVFLLVAERTSLMQPGIAVAFLLGWPWRLDDDAENPPGFPRAGR